MSLLLKILFPLFFSFLYNKNTQSIKRISKIQKNQEQNLNFQCHYQKPSAPTKKQNSKSNDSNLKHNISSTTKNIPNNNNNNQSQKSSPTKHQNENALLPFVDHVFKTNQPASELKKSSETNVEKIQQNTCLSIQHVCKNNIINTDEIDNNVANIKLNNFSTELNIRPQVSNTSNTVTSKLLDDSQKITNNNIKIPHQNTAHNYLATDKGNKHEKNDQGQYSNSLNTVKQEQRHLKTQSAAVANFTPASSSSLPSKIIHESFLNRPQDQDCKSLKISDVDKNCKIVCQDLNYCETGHNHQSSNYLSDSQVTQNNLNLQNQTPFMTDKGNTLDLLWKL